MYVTENKKSFLEKLQLADEATKKRWLVVSTVVIMIVVVYIWLAYFNSLVAGMSGQPVAAAPQGGSVSFWQVAKNGMASLYGVFIDKAHGLGRVLQAPREYIIKPPK